MRISIVFVVLLGSLSASAETPLSVMSAWSPGGTIPTKFTCDGQGKAPPVGWSNVPANTQSIAILIDDADAPQGVYTHWIVANIPPHESALMEGGALPQGAVAGTNSTGSTGYTPICPPPSSTHRYRVHVFALDRMLSKPSSRGALGAQIRGHVLAEGELVGTYTRGVGTPHAPGYGQ